MTELGELLEFLSHDRIEIRLMSVEIVKGLTGEEEGLVKLSSRAMDAVAGLSARLGDRKEISKPALDALVNLSAHDPKLASAIAAPDLGVVEKAMKLITLPEWGAKEVVVMLLVNLSQAEEGALQLLQLDQVHCGVFLSLLIRLFLTEPSRSDDRKEQDPDPFAHVASILMNLTQTEPGRRAMTNPEKGLLRQILPQLGSKSEIRRHGIAGTVRNCCFDAPSSLPSLLHYSESLWPALLLPLSGTRAYSKEDLAKMPLELSSPLSHEREASTDPHIQVQVAEALFLIAQEAEGRKALWTVNAPRILQVGYEDEEDPGAMEAFERLGALLIEESGMDVEET